MHNVFGECVRVICVDDHQLILSHILGYVKASTPEAEVVGFDRTEDALEYAKKYGCDILFTEIELYGKPSGIELARCVQKINPRVNIIFTTVCSEQEYAEEVVRIRPSGYLTKVITKQDIQGALQHLLYTVNQQ